MNKMMSLISSYTPLLAIVALVIGGVLISSNLQSPETQMAVDITKLKGAVEIKTDGSDIWVPVVMSGDLEAGDSIRTGEFSYATIVYFDGSQTILYPNTQITITALSGSRDGKYKVIVFDQWLGQTVNRVKRLVDPSSRFEIITPTAITAVRGTEFQVDVTETGATRVAVAEGVVDVTAQGTIVKVDAGHSTTVQPGESPTLIEPLSISPEGMMWTEFDEDEIGTAMHGDQDGDGNDGVGDDGDEDGDDDDGDEGDDVEGGDEGDDGDSECGDEGGDEGVEGDSGCGEDGDDDEGTDEESDDGDGDDDD